MREDRELEDLLRRSMRHHAEQMPDAETSPAHKRTRRVPIMLAAAASVVVITAGAVAITSMTPLFSGGSASGSASTTMARGLPRPLFEPSKSAADGSYPAPTAEATLASQPQLIQLSLTALNTTRPLCSTEAPQHVDLKPGDVTAIYICHGGSVTQEDGSVWSTAVVDQVVGGIDALLESSARPDEPLGDLMCTTEAYLTPTITVHSDAGVQNIAPPVDICGKPQPRWLAALSNLTVQTVREVQLEMEKSSLAIETGCAFQWKDVLTLEKPATAKGSPQPLPEQPMTMCVYSSDKVEVGTLIAGLHLSARAVTTLNAVYPLIESDPECDPTDHSRFVVLTGRTGWVQIGLDGCGVFGSPGGMWSGSSDLRAYLTWLIEEAGQGEALLSR